MACLVPYLAPLAVAPSRAGHVIAALGDRPLVLAALPVHQPAAQVIHAVGLPRAGASATALRALHTYKEIENHYTKTMVHTHSLTHSFTHTHHIGLFVLHVNIIC